MLPPLKPLGVLPSLPALAAPLPLLQPVAPRAHLTTAQLDALVPRYVPGSHAGLPTDALLVYCRGVVNYHGEWQAWAYRAEGFGPVRDSARAACIAALEGHKI